MRFVTRWGVWTEAQWERRKEIWEMPAGPEREAAATSLSEDIARQAIEALERHAREYISWARGQRL